MKFQPSTGAGDNRTGATHARELHGAPAPAGDARPTTSGSIAQLAEVRTRYARAAGPVGTMPSLPRARDELLPLLDLLAARLGFERAGVRLYDALIAKRESHGGFGGGPARADLVRMRDEELQHVAMLDGLIRDFAGDPTAVTPAALREATACRGLADVLLDPRTTLLDGLEAMAIAELTDHEQWLGLIDLARGDGRDDLVRIFQTAQLVEEDHLSKVRRWIASGRVQVRSQF